MLVMGFAKGGDEVACVVEIVDNGGEVRGGIGGVPWKPNREAEDRDTRPRCPRDEGHRGERLGQGVGEPRAPEGTFGGVEVQSNGRAIRSEDRNRCGEVLLGPDEVSIVKVPAIKV